MPSDAAGKNDESFTIIRDGGITEQVNAIDLIDSELGRELNKAGISGPANEKVLLAARRVFQRHETHSGPLPSASQFQAYENACPGSADRILRMAENEQSHRFNWESSELRFEHTYAYIGLCMGLIIAVLLISGSVYLAMGGQPTVAGLFLAASVVGMAAKFIDGRISRSHSSPSPQEAPKTPPQSSPVKSSRRKR